MASLWTDVYCDLHVVPLLQTREWCEGLEPSISNERKRPWDLINQGLRHKCL